MKAGRLVIIKVQSDGKALSAPAQPWRPCLRKVLRFLAVCAILAGFLQMLGMIPATTHLRSSLTPTFLKASGDTGFHVDFNAKMPPTAPPYYFPLTPSFNMQPNKQLKLDIGRVVYRLWNGNPVPGNSLYYSAFVLKPTDTQTAGDMWNCPGGIIVDHKLDWMHGTAFSLFYFHNQTMSALISGQQTEATFLFEPAFLTSQSNIYPFKGNFELGVVSYTSATSLSFRAAVFFSTDNQAEAQSQAAVLEHQVVDMPEPLHIDA